MPNFGEEQEADQALLDALRRQAHIFPIAGDNVEVLQSPSQFYAALLEGLAGAQRHISVAALYAGTEGGREAEFVAALAAAAHDASRPGLQVDVLLDALRSTRPTRGAADGTLTSTAQVLSDTLLSGRPTAAVNVALFHTPALRGLLRRLLPPRVREVVGVMHMKAFVFDDSLLLSGANLSNSYFTNRQDRYLLVRDAPELAAFVRQAVCTVSHFSYQLLPGGSDSTKGGDSSTCGQSGAPGPAPGPTPSGVGAPGGGGSSLLGGAAAASASTGASGGGSSVWAASAAASDRHSRRRRDLFLEFLMHRAELLSASVSRSALRSRPLPGAHLLPPGGASAAQHSTAPAFRLASPPCGLDPARHGRQFGRSLRGELLRLFVPPGAEPGVVDFPALLDELEGEVVVGSAQPQAANDTGEAAGTAAGVPAAWAQGDAGPAVGQCEGRWRAQTVDAASCGQAWKGGSSGAAAAGSTAGAAAAGGAASPAGAPVEDTWVMPLVQAGFCGLRQEERCTLRMLSWAAQQREVGPGGGGGSGSGSSKSGVLYLSSPYLNLARPYEWFLAQAQHLHLELLTSSPEANGFFGSKGVSGFIPTAYSLLEHRTWRRLTRHERGAAQHAQLDTLHAKSLGREHWPPVPGVLSAMQRLAKQQHAQQQQGGGAEGAGAATEGAGQQAQHGSRSLLEYARSGWEFHAKGLWFMAPAGVSPSVTAVGSSNYGFRSMHRDLEMQFLVLTRNPQLQQALGQEFQRLRQYAHAVDDSHFRQPGRRGGAVARMAVRLLRGLL